jgi:hypothetical protein
MTDQKPAPDCIHCGVSRAVRRFARKQFASLARRVVAALQRAPASGIFGDDFQHKTLWDEYCHEVQNGPQDALAYAWNNTLEPILEDKARLLQHEEAVLLSIGAAWELDEDEAHHCDCVDTALIHRNLKDVVSRLAGARDMSRFDPSIAS